MSDTIAPTAPQGLVILESRHGPQETVDAFERAVTERGITILARIDHAAAAAKVGLSLRPTVVVIFGNPKAGTPLMAMAQTAGIDLPLKALIYQDESGKTWIAYNDPAWIARRHGVGEDALPTLGAVAAGLAAVAKQAAGGAADVPA